MRRLLFLTEAQGIAARRTLVVGTNARAQEIALDMLAHPEHGYRFLGFVANAWEAAPPATVPEKFRLAADMAGFVDYLRGHVVDEVLVCLPLAALCDTATTLVSECEEQGVSVTVVTRLFELKNPHHRPGGHGGEVVVTISNSMADERERILKRFLDVAVSLTTLALLSPLLVAVWALVRATSPGPAFFVQERVGLNKRRFKFYKFRTMVQNAVAMQEELESQNEMDGAIFKIKNDPRITPLGRILRRTSIDELPQLLNVLRGDMSLVGPRPLPVRGRGAHRKGLAPAALWRQARHHLPVADKRPQQRSLRADDGTRHRIRGHLVGGAGYPDPAAHRAGGAEHARGVLRLVEDHHIQTFDAEGQSLSPVGQAQVQAVFKARMHEVLHHPDPEAFDVNLAPEQPLEVLGNGHRASGPHQASQGRRLGGVVLDAAQRAVGCGRQAQGGGVSPGRGRTAHPPVFPPRPA